jgi:transcriptional regulator with XRE-family HTH domain
VDNRVEVREFLTSRRAKITPQAAGLPQVGQRRVPGLWRSEVAALAGVSVEYYAKLERGSLGGVSAGVLDAIARALQLDEAERAHLFHLAHAADGTSAAMRPRRRAKQWTVRPSLQWTLDSISTGPAIVGNNRSDLLAANHLGRALYADVYSDPTHSPNFARFAFLDGAAHRFYPDWDLAADITVANLRTAAGQDPHDKALHDLRIHTTGIKLLHHPVVGDLDLPFESFPLAADPSQGLLTYTAEPDSPSQDALNLLASWAATNRLEQPVSTAD